MKHFSGSAFVLVLLLGGLGLVLPGPAQAFRAQMELTVIQVPGSSAFEVVEEYGAGPRQIWCAAAEHARDVARLPTAQRLYIARGLGVSDLAGGRKTVRFSPGPVAAEGPRQDGPYTITLRDVGASLSIGHALSYCDDRIEDLFDRF
ncbi:MAG: hypothetical protein NWR54_11145 [Paracoccaceae bacterium]|jgi:hypothetical protein|nr:hypothetical protein [Paracoccaceae bacterium]